MPDKTFNRIFATYDVTITHSEETTALYNIISHTRGKLHATDRVQMTTELAASFSFVSFCAIATPAAHGAKRCMDK